MNIESLKEDKIKEIKEVVIKHLQGRFSSISTNSSISIKNKLLELSIEHKVKCSKLFKAIPLDIDDPQLYKILGSSQNTSKITYIYPGDDPQLHEILGSSQNTRKIKYVYPEDDYQLQKILGSSHNTSKIKIKYEYPEKEEKQINRNTNLYNLLEEIAKKDQHTANLLGWIDSTRPPFNWTGAILSGSVLSIALGIFFHFNKHYFYAIVNWMEKTFPIVSKYIRTFFSLLKNVPLFLVASNIGILIVSWYKILKNRSMSLDNKVLELLFKTTTAALTISGYVLSFITAGIVTPPIIILFVLRASMDGIKSIVDMMRLIFDKEKYENKDHSWRADIANAKHQFFKNAAMQYAGVKFVAAIFTAGAVALMFLGPASLLLTVSCLSLIWLLDVSKSVLINHLQKKAQDDVVNHITQIEGLKEDEEMRPDEDNLIHQKENLRNREIQVTERERQVTERERQLTDQQGMFREEQLQSAEKDMHRKEHLREQEIIFDASINTAKAILGSFFSNRSPEPISEQGSLALLKTRSDRFFPSVKPTSSDMSLRSSSNASEESANDTEVIETKTNDDTSLANQPKLT